MQLLDYLYALYPLRLHTNAAIGHTSGSKFIENQIKSTTAHIVKVVINAIRTNSVKLLLKALGAWFIVGGIIKFQNFA
jgi:hypothetical protein